MTTNTSLFPVMAAACLCLLMVGCSRGPAGWDDMVRRNGGSQPDTIADPQIAADYAVQWAKDRQKSLAFFTKELDSPAPSHVKTSIWCLGMLVMVVEKSAASAEDKAQFERDFPAEKVKQVLVSHPEYEYWYSGLRRTKFGAGLPPSKDMPSP
jgi:hypothetical protein